MIMSSKLGLVRSRLNALEKYAGSQKRKNQNIGSINAFPTTNAQVCGNENSLNHLIGTFSSTSPSSCPFLMRARSSSLINLLFSGLLYIKYQKAIHIKPSAPVIKNTSCHP